ncbi:PREDICTED: uncharacterized protein LOC109176853 [Ipomoea nil]|uniref:uncharacterized protein LOC109176853 n=1 Tax=Ipomoea nil TaxID=35883 RepID=UPI0009017282|nr:PREDICTED: uncharacterized protein LOC109176853 [Ipomoea nil]
MGFNDGSNPCPPAYLLAEEGMPTQSKPAHRAWVRQDQALLSMVMSSLFDEVMSLAIGHHTSRSILQAVVNALASSSRSRSLNLLGQLQSLHQGDRSVADYISKAWVLVEDLTLAGRSITLEEQNLYVLKGLQPEFRSLASSLNIRGQPVTLQELADLLGTEEFLSGGEAGGGSPTAFTVQRGRQKRGRGGQSRRGGGSGGGRNCGDRNEQVFYVSDPVDNKWSIVLQSKRSIVGVGDVVDEEEYDHFDETPPFSIGVQSLPLEEDNFEISYMRSNHEEGLWVYNRTS